MTQVIRNNKTIFELQEESDYVWTDGDDSALYDAGFEDARNKAIDIMNQVLLQLDDYGPSAFVVRGIISTVQQASPYDE
jgi:hypothetical protein